ncbi:MAG TPA: S24/S26 family peptidase [Opitutaceae bacterium]|nr:S24/S26 family peptidase [Opitutaceae bacterium]
MKSYPILYALLSVLLASGSTAIARDNSVTTINLDKRTAIATAIAWTGQSPDHGWTYPQATGSMRPTLDECSILLLERASARDLKEGDIVCYTRAPDGSGKETIVHRAVAIASNGYIYMAGDNNRYADGWIAPVRICWRVTQIIQTPSRL